MHVLTAESGPLAGKSFEITADGVKIGRHPTQNQIVVQDDEVSRQHARVYLSTDSKVWIEDSSANGTFVNGRRIQKETLRAGDKIRLGLNPSNTFSYGDGGATRAAAASGQDAVLRELAEARARGTVRMRGEEGNVPQGARLQLIIDRYTVDSVPLTSTRTVLGRLAGPDKMRIDSPGVSEAHAELTFSPQGNALLTDLNSEQGTWVNGERITQRALREGDMIRLGESDSRLLLYREAHKRALPLRDIDLKQALTRLGRDPSNQVPLDHPTVSLFHAEISKQDNIFTIEDKNSTNGTFVNGERIRGRQQLKPHDRITLGAIQLSFDGSQIEQRTDGKGVRLNAYALQRTVKNNGQRKVLLDGISLAIEPREFVGLLGPSGSGKSTLMNSLSGIRPADQGRVLINQAELYSDHGALRALMGYVPQDDILHISLTVRECLHYAARLRLPDDFDQKAIAARVSEVIRKVYLTDHAQKPIYVLSGGQRKRVNLGIELLCNPSLLFLDEPTAGQDPRTEMELMRLFREVANGGSTIILTTHLLGSFNLLDKVVVLVAGRLCYFGPTQELLQYFRASDPTQVYNTLEDKTKGPEYWAKQFQDSEIYDEFVAKPLGLKTTDVRPEPAPLPTPAPPPTKVIEAPKHSASRNFSTLLSRLMALKFKDWTNIAVLVLPPPIISLLLGRMMPNQPDNPRALFIMVIVALWFGCSAAVREIVDERQIYSRERQRNLPIPAYLGSKLVYFVGLAGVQSFLLVGFARLMSLEQEHFLTAWLIIWLTTFHGALLGLLISAWSPSAERALFIFPLVLIPQLLFAGSLLPIRDVKMYLPADPPTNPSAYYEPAKGMSSTMRYTIAPLIVARWAVEALGETYVHDRKFGPPPSPTYSFQIMNAFALTFDNQDPETEFNRVQAEYAITKLPPQPTAANLVPYFGILGGMAVVMIGWIAIVLKLRDKQG